MITTGIVGRHGVEVMTVDASMNHLHGRHGLSFQYKRLPTEAVGSHTLTLTNVVIGSRIAIRDQADTTTLYDQVAATSTVGISLSVYSAGSPLNDWRIKIRKASETPYYQPYETLMTANVGNSSIYVSQLPD